MGEVSRHESAQGKDFGIGHQVFITLKNGLVYAGFGRFLLLDTQNQRMDYILDTGEGTLEIAGETILTIEVDA